MTSSEPAGDRKTARAIALADRAPPTDQPANRAPPADPPADRATRAIALGDPAATDRLGAALGLALGPGDTLALSGPLGAGKSALARAAIRARLGNAEAEVPSPTYTLVQVYGEDADTLWHADLYRLGDASEVAELGLDEAFVTAAVIVEWPERLGPALPARRVDLALDITGDTTRRARLALSGEGWERVEAALGRVA